MKRLVLVDGYSIFFRAHFSPSNANIRNGAIYGFTRALTNIKTNPYLKHSHIAVALDTGKKTFRHTMYEKYKAQRPPCPVELIPQFPMIREINNILNIPSLEMEGYEADDVIATYAKRAEKEGYEVIIIGIDKDLMQLVNETTIMYDAFKGKKILIKDVVEKWGVQPKQVLDVLSLMGDTSDNVPGVPKIGPKTAANLINEFKNINNLIDNVDKVAKQTIRENIKKNVNDLILSRDLIRLYEEVPLNVSIDSCMAKSFNDNDVRDFLNKNTKDTKKGEFLV
ncbi:MAG: hypothetical protein LBT02_02725 [Rickettsiales bacterium]|jgi:DNA polymerase-1|nr:hypothetical protein [Rickettsiales bacterium]